jgi:hypothetical protein
MTRRINSYTPRLKRRGGRVPLCPSWLHTIFFLNSAHMYSIIGGISGYLYHYEPVCGHAHNAGCRRLRTTRSEPHRALSGDRRAPGNLSRLAPRRPPMLKACRLMWNTSFMTICSVASWRMAFCAWDVTPVRTKRCWLSAVNAERFAPPARVGAWRRRRRTWSRACAPCNTAWYPRFKRVELGGRF